LRSRQQISKLLTIIALLLWSHSILYARLEIGYLGLIHGLPFSFFIALAFLILASTVLWLSSEKNGRLLCLQLVVLICALWLIPLITGGSPPFVDHTYRNLGYVYYVITHGEFSTAVISYFSWPGAFVTPAIISDICLVSFKPLVELGLFPLLLQLSCLIPLYVFLRNTLGESRSSYCWVGCWLFYLANWVGHLHLNPQGFGFFLLLVLLALVTSPRLWRENAKPFILVSLISIVFAALAVTHLITSLAFLCILVGLYLIKRDKRTAFVIAACLMLFIAWNLIGAKGLLEGKADSTEGFVTVQQSSASGEITESGEITKTMLVLDPELIAEREITGHMLGSQSHIVLANIKILFATMFALIGLAGVIIICLVKRKLKTCITILVITLAPLALASLSFHYGNMLRGEILSKLYLYTLPGMAYFGAMALGTSDRKMVVILFLLLFISCPLHVICEYGNQEADYLSAGEVSGMEFFNDKTTEGYIIGAWPMGWMETPDRYKQKHLQDVDWEAEELFSHTDNYQQLNRYIGISKHDEQQYTRLYGQTSFVDQVKLRLESDTHITSFYRSPYLKLYFRDMTSEPY
jgi:hypothetical protein